MNDSDPYIFCYACGVRQYWAQFFHWDGQSLKEVTPTPLPAALPAELRAFNDRAAELAAASLFADALEQIEQGAGHRPRKRHCRLERRLDRHHLEASRQEASTSAFPC